MACGIDDDDLASSLVQSNVCQVFLELLQTAPHEFAHRAAVGIGYLAENPVAARKLLDLGARSSLSKVSKKRNPDWASAADAAASAADSLRRAAVFLDSADKNQKPPPIAPSN